MFTLLSGGLKLLNYLTGETLRVSTTSKEVLAKRRATFSTLLSVRTSVLHLEIPQYGTLKATCYNIISLEEERE